jgi:transposase
VLRGDQEVDDPSEREELAALRREVKDLRRSNEILKSASVFFARELDQPRTR